MGAPVKAGRSRLSEIQTNMGLRSSFGFRSLHYTLIQGMVRVTPGLEGFKELEQFASAFQAVNTMYTHLYNAIEVIRGDNPTLGDIYGLLHKKCEKSKGGLLLTLHKIERMRTNKTWTDNKKDYQASLIKLYSDILGKKLDSYPRFCKSLFGDLESLELNSTA